MNLSSEKLLKDNSFLDLLRGDSNQSRGRMSIIKDVSVN